MWYVEEKDTLILGGHYSQKTFKTKKEAQKYANELVKRNPHAQEGTRYVSITDYGSETPEAKIMKKRNAIALRMFKSNKWTRDEARNYLYTGEKPKKETNSAIKKFEKAMKSRRVQKKAQQRQKETRNYKNVIIPPKIKSKTEAKAMTKTKSKRGGRKSTTWIKKSKSTTQKMARLGAKVLKLIKTAKPRIRNGKGTNTRYARKLAKNTYLYKTRKA